MKIDRFGEDAGDGSADVQVRGVGDAYAQRNADGDRVDCGRRGGLGRGDSSDEAQWNDAEANKQRHAEVAGGPRSIRRVSSCFAYKFHRDDEEFIQGGKAKENKAQLWQLTDGYGELNFAVFNFAHNFVASNIPYLES